MELGGGTGHTIHFYISWTPFRHTGAFLESAEGIVEKFDFGYATTVASWIGLQKGEKYYHLNIRTLSKEFLNNCWKYGIAILFSLPYQSIDRGIMLDRSTYSLSLNNCRHYLLRLLDRLSLGRRKTPEEERAYRYFREIAYNPRPHMPCLICNKCNRYRGQGHSTIEIEKKEISPTEYDTYKDSIFIDILEQDGNKSMVIIHGTKVSAPEIVP